jgi:hypothetical protein
MLIWPVDPPGGGRLLIQRASRAARGAPAPIWRSRGARTITCRRENLAEGVPTQNASSVASRYLQPTSVRLPSASEPCYGSDPRWWSLTHSNNKRLMAHAHVIQDVRGHVKVPAGGQVVVPAGGQLEVPASCSSCRRGA